MNLQFKEKINEGQVTLLHRPRGLRQSGIIQAKFISLEEI